MVVDAADQRVLAVDDNATNRMILKELFASWRMEAVLADSGSAGMAELDAAVRAPSGGNSQNWRFLLVDSVEVKAAIAPLYQRAIAIDEKTLGPEHPDLAAWLNNLAELYRQQGKYA